MLRIATASLVAFLLAGTVEAHTITWPDGQTFTFDPNCCNGSDCAAIPVGSIKEVKGGYAVEYWQFYLGARRHFKAMIPHGDRRIKFNPFADRIMACASLISGDEPGTLSPRCIYPVQPSM